MSAGNVTAVVEAVSHIASIAAGLVLLVLAAGLRLASAPRSGSPDLEGGAS